MKINKQSRFYRWIAAWTNINSKESVYWEHKINVCDLTRAFVESVIKCLFVVALLSTLAGMAGYAIYSLGIFAVKDQHTFFVALAIVGVPVAAAFGLNYLVNVVKNDNGNRGRRPGPISMMYRSWKEKMCFWIELE